MRRDRLPLWIALVCAAATSLHLGLTLDALPEPVASHFDGSGHPNGYQGKLAFVVSATLLQLLFVGLTWVAPSMMRTTRDELINLPHKAYWLAPERREATKERLAQWTAWFCCATALLLAGVFELVIRANLQRKPLSGQVWLLLGCYVVFAIASTVSWLRGFRHPGQ